MTFCGRLGMVVLWAVLVMGCTRDAMDQVRVSLAERYVSQLSVRPLLPSAIRFHENPSVGEWAHYREGGSMISYRVLSVDSDETCLVEQTIFFRQATEWVRLELRIATHTGVILAATGRWGGDGVNLSPPLELPVQKHVGLYKQFDLSPLWREGETIAGYQTHMCDSEGCRYWYAPDGAFFAVDLNHPWLAGWGGLVKSQCNGLVNRELIGCGIDESAASNPSIAVPQGL